MNAPDKSCIGGCCGAELSNEGLADWVVDRMIHEELQHASNFSTRATIKLRVLFRLAKRMGISRNVLYETRDTVFVDPSVSKAVEDVWCGRSLFSAGTVALPRENSASPFEDATRLSVTTRLISNEDSAVVERFLARDFSFPGDVHGTLFALEKKLRGSFSRRMPLMRRDLDHRDLPLRELWCLLAADGLHLPLEGHDKKKKKKKKEEEEEEEKKKEEAVSTVEGIRDWKPYWSNLSYPLTFGELNDPNTKQTPAEIHARAVRTLYRDVAYATPERIGTMLRRWLFEGGKDVKKNGPDCRNTPPSSGGGDSSSSDGCGSSSSGSDDEAHDYDDYLAESFKRYVGIHLDKVFEWLKEREFRIVKKKSNVENIGGKCLSKRIRKKVSTESHGKKHKKNVAKGKSISESLKKKTDKSVADSIGKTEKKAEERSPTKRSVSWVKSAPIKKIKLQRPLQETVKESLERERMSCCSSDDFVETSEKRGKGLSEVEVTETISPSNEEFNRL